MVESQQQESFNQRASIAGARTVRIGSFGKTGVPSGTAQMSPVKRKLFR